MSHANQGYNELIKKTIESYITTIILESIYLLIVRACIPFPRNVISIAPGFRLGFEIRFCFNCPIGAAPSCPDGAIQIFFMPISPA
jgi:hypothetical protein